MSPRPHMTWRHVVISTHATWLPGDPRGFRSRKHRVHSSGDYKNPPPKSEHASLHRHLKSKSDVPTVIPDHLRETIGNKIVHSLQAQGIHLLAVAVSGTHAHLLAELPIDPAETKLIIGKAKHAASIALRDEIPGKLWAAGGAYKSIETREHQQCVFRYILEHAHKENAWVWSFRDDDGA